jgi:hypothetical protein
MASKRAERGPRGEKVGVIEGDMLTENLTREDGDALEPSRDTYRGDLSISDLVATLRALLDEQRRAERLICRYLADFADAVDARGRGIAGGFSDIYHAARCLFAMGVRKTRERLRVGRALRVLPRIEKAFVDGTISYSRVREVTRVARSEDEDQWLRLGCELPMRVLERRVVEAGGSTDHERRMSEPAALHWTTPETVEVRLSLRAETWALLQRAMAGARRAAEQDALLSDEEALAALARDALAAQASGQSEIGRTVVLYECRSCARTELETGAGPIELGDGTAAALGCGAKVCDLRTEGRVERRGGPLPRAVARAVRLRDRDRCRVPGCSRRRYVDVHHIDERAHGGVHARKNCVCLCSTHHRMLHERQLVIRGNAEAELEFLDELGRPLFVPRAPVTPEVRGDHLLAPPVTQGGSLTGGGVDAHAPSAAEEAALDPASAELVAHMGNRGGWNVDALCNATGLPANTVAAALMMLELAGTVRRDVCGSFVATGAMQRRATIRDAAPRS